jgi:hypothetical protein
MPNERVLAFGAVPPDHVSQQILRRRQQKYSELLETLQQMDSTIARMTYHRNGHATRIRTYARENQQELEDASLLTNAQRALQRVDLGLRALAIAPEQYDTPDKLRAAMVDAGVAEGYADAFVAFHAAWTLLAAAELSGA